METADNPRCPAARQSGTPADARLVAVALRTGRSARRRFVRAERRKEDIQGENLGFLLERVLLVRFLSRDRK